MHARDKQTATENDAKMFYPLGKNLEETQGGVATIPPPPPVLPSVNHDP